MENGTLVCFALCLSDADKTQQLHLATDQNDWPGSIYAWF